MSSSSFKVVCVGVVTVDALSLADRYPAADERVVGEEVIVSGGGPAANAAVVPNSADSRRSSSRAGGPMRSDSAAICPSAISDGPSW